MYNILFFSRSGYHELFCKLNDEKYNSFHAVINLNEKEMVLREGGTHIVCFEEQFDSLVVADFPNDYLKIGFYPDRFMGSLTHEDRRIVLGKLITFWKNAIIEFKIDACVHETISYEPEEVLSLVCQELGCIDLNFLATPINGYFFWKPDPYSSSIPQSVFDSLTPTKTNIGLARKHVNEVLLKTNRPFYLDSVQDRNYGLRGRKKMYKDLKIFVKSLLKKTDISYKAAFKRKVFYFNDYDQVDLTELDRLLNDYYNRIGKYDELSDIDISNTLLFPLHYEPEATLYYFSSDFAEQVNVIQQILKYLPLDCTLLVKEHPCQKGRLMTREYQELKKKNSNLYFLKANEDTNHLIKDSRAIITICGSVGWEGLIAGKPVFVLGDVFYDKHPSVIKLDEFKEIRRWFQNGLKEASDLEVTIKYFARIMELAHQGYYSSTLRNSEENHKNFRNAIISGIKYFQNTK